MTLTPDLAFALDLDAVYTSAAYRYVAELTEVSDEPSPEVARAAHLAGLHAVHLAAVDHKKAQRAPRDYSTLFASMAGAAEAAMDEAPRIITLGDLIGELAAAPSSNIVKVVWRGTLRNPGNVDSYRGYYSQLFIDFTASDERTVKSLLKNLRKAMGSTFEGYKGGDYTMGAHTGIFVDQHGMCEQIAACAVISQDGLTVILTERVVD